MIRDECRKRIKKIGRGAQTRAAAAIGCKQQQLSGWLSGTNGLSEDRVRALVEWLGGRYVAAHADWTDQ